ncbi:MAG TPA: mechanosensitive ion channel [Thermomicrobiales bacterium]|nr:mechanosensitive ion channel [Thermomicrobiales bacterium]
MPTTTIHSTTEALLTALGGGLALFFAWIPRLVGAIVLLLIGWLVGRLVGALVTKALRLIHFDQVVDRAGAASFLRNAGVRLDPAGVIGALAKWFIYIIFWQAAVSTLGFPEVTQILNEIIAFLPRIILAIVILLVGALAANLLANLVRGALGAARFRDANVLANVARWAVLAFAVVAALSQVEIAPAIVNTLWSAAIGGTALALALAFGLGARDAAGDVAAGQLVKGEIRGGMAVSVDGQSGIVEQVGAVYTTIRTGEGQVKIPNAELARKTVLVGAPGQPGPAQLRPRAAGDD